MKLEHSKRNILSMQLVYITSKSLKELIGKRLVFCKNPEDKLYELTKKGKEILKELK